MSWGRRWLKADPMRGRASIKRLCGCTDHPGGTFAAAPFMTMVDDQGQMVIAGAVGCGALFEVDRLLDWSPDDIEAVILWDPRSNKAAMADGTDIVLPAYTTELVVYADPAAFFRAWAAARLRYFERRDRPESDDNELPGALVTAPLNHIPWTRIEAETIKAGPGVHPAALSRAVMQAVRLPRVERA